MRRLLVCLAIGATLNITHAGATPGLGNAAKKEQSSRDPKPAPRQVYTANDLLERRTAVPASQTGAASSAGGAAKAAPSSPTQRSTSGRGSVSPPRGRVITGDDLLASREQTNQNGRGTVSYPGGDGTRPESGNTEPTPVPIPPPVPVPTPAPEAVPGPMPTPAPGPGGKVWYVRTDGGLYGTTATTCNGQHDAPYVGGNGPNCAVKHPFEILGTKGGSPRATRVAGGDTIIIKNGSYRMGHSPGEYDSGACSSSWAYDCYMNAVPSGLSADAKTKIYGEGYASGCSRKPELWATHGAYMLLNLEGTSNVDIQCLDLTDHEDCGGQWAGGNRCDVASSPMFGAAGVRGWNGINNSFASVSVHGFAGSGMTLGKQSDLSMTDVEIVGNGFVGLDQDNSAHSGNNSWGGKNTFTRVKINWNGCAENYPVNGGYNNCTDQNDTGYGDGWGSPGGGTEGSYTFLDSQFLYNTSDGLDLLYMADPASQIVVERSRFEGNVGNAVKVGAGNVLLRNNIIIANCNYWAGKTFIAPHLSTCRAAGNAVVINLAAGSTFDAVNNTVTGESDILFAATGCGASDRINIVNNIIHGYTQWNTAGEKTSWFYPYGGCTASNLISADWNIIYNVKETNPCSGRRGCLEQNPLFLSLDYVGDRFDVRLQATSPAIGAGLAVGTVVGETAVPRDDVDGVVRGATKVLGAVGYPR